MWIVPVAYFGYSSDDTYTLGTIMIDKGTEGTNARGAEPTYG